MTVETATAFTISHTVEQDILAGIESSFEGFRSRIAMLSVEACGTLTDMFSPLGPVMIDADIIDIDAIEWAQYELEMVPVTIDADADILEFVAA